MKFALKRKFTQFAALVLTNPEFANIFSGKVYKGDGKYICAPGLNCYSCPAAVLSCPIGALQAVGASVGYFISFYVLGFIMLLGVLLGRFVCGYLCPFGLFQDILAKIPFAKRKLPPFLKYAKYISLILFVIILPIVGAFINSIGEPAFCKYICPSGTLTGAVPLLISHSEFRESLGFLFVLKASLLIGIIIGCLIIYRFFCQTLCPLGALYGLFNRISLYRIKFDEDRCVSCNACKNACPIKINPITQGNFSECIRCGKCAGVCKENALSMGFE